MMTSENMATLNTMLGGGNAEFNSDRTRPEYEDRMSAIFDPDIEVHEPLCLPHGGIHKGRETWLKVRRTMIEHWDQNLEILHVWEDREANVIILNYMMDWTGKATGRRVQMPAIEVLTFKNAKIVKVEFYPRDAKALAESLEQN